MAGVSERHRDKAIVEVSAALVLVSSGLKCSDEMCHDLATGIVDYVTEHAVETVRALIAAEEGLKKPG